MLGERLKSSIIKKIYIYIHMRLSTLHSFTMVECLAFITIIIIMCSFIKTDKNIWVCINIILVSTLSKNIF